MDLIVNNLQTPSWWFDGLFFAIIAALLPKLFAIVVPQLWRWASIYVPKLSKNVARARKKKSLLIIKRSRQHAIKVQWLVSRYWALASVTIIYVIFVSITYLILPVNPMQEDRNIIVLTLFGSMYSIVLITIREKKSALRVVNAHIQWQKAITCRSKTGKGQ